MNEESELSAHPMSDEMRVTVLQNLSALEQQHQVKVLFTCESGSRDRGFTSPDSYYDVRFIYVNQLPWYLTVEPGRYVIEQPISGELDINGWDLRKTLQLLRESNPTLQVWLRSPIVYQQDADWVARLRSLAEEGFSPARGYHHYVSMAKKNLREHLYDEVVRYKKYLYMAAPIAGRAVDTREPWRAAPASRRASQPDADRPRRAGRGQRATGGQDAAGESATSPSWVGIHDFVEADLAKTMSYTLDKGPKADGHRLNQYLHDAVLHYGTQT